MTTENTPDDLGIEELDEFTVPTPWQNIGRVLIIIGNFLQFF